MDPFVDHKFVLAANISSWEQTKDWLFTGHGDGVYLQCLQETRLLDCATVHAKRHAEAAGWTAVMAPALPGGARGPGTGGLAMLARSHLGLVEICPHDQPEQWRQRRWHAASLGGFRRPLVCVNLYAVPSIGPTGSNLQILSEVGSFLTTLGHGWWIIAGDFNMSPDEIQSTGVIAALGADLLAAPGPTVYPASGKPRAIDHFIVGPDFIVDSSPCHIHRPCLLALSRVCAAERIPVLISPARVSGEFPSRESDNAHQIVGRMQEFANTLTHATVSAHTIWTRFHQLADDWIWAAAKGLPAKPPSTKGHGCTPKTVFRTVFPRKTQWNCTKLDPAFSVVVALYRRIMELVRLLKQGFARDVLLPVWKAVGRMADRVRPDLQDDLFPITWNADQEPLPSFACISQFEAFANLLSVALDNHVRSKHSARALSWKRWCSEQLIGGAKQLCRWVKAKSHSLVAAVVSEQSPTDVAHRPAIVAQRCLNDWAEVWRAERTQVSDQSLPREWLSCVNPQEAPAVTVEEIRSSLHKPSGPGRGIDGWDKPILAALPDPALTILSHLFTAVERERCFPGPGRGTIVVLLSKGQGHQPLQQRPIGKLARLYRLWASIRLKLTRQWRAERAWEWSWGCGRRRGALDASWDVSCHAEQAWATGKSFASILFDLRQCFDRVALGNLQFALFEHSFPRLCPLWCCINMVLRVSCPLQEPPPGGSNHSLGSQRVVLWLQTSFNAILPLLSTSWWPIIMFSPWAISKLLFGRSQMLHTPGLNRFQTWEPPSMPINVSQLPTALSYVPRSPPISVICTFLSCRQQLIWRLTSLLPDLSCYRNRPNASS